MRRDTRHHQAAKIKEINQKDTRKEKERTWVQCHICEDWLYEETYFTAEWQTGPDMFYEHGWGYGYTPTIYRICNSCCHTTLDVVDYLVGLTAKNKESYDKSYKEWEKAQKKKQKEALCIVDGKNYSFTFKEEKKN